MKGFKRVLRDCSPGLVGDLLFSLFNVSLYRARHGGAYGVWSRYFQKYASANSADIQQEQVNRLRVFLRWCANSSQFYQPILNGIDLDTFSVADLQKLPILEKETLIRNAPGVATIARSEALVSVTGGTTGNSMEVFYKPEDMQERFAFIDTFRAESGYRLGKRIAWCTGKEILSKMDVRIGRYHKDDFFHKVRFFSTFHLTESTFPSYWQALQKFQPEFLLGFPSFYYDLSIHAARKGLKLGGVKAFFPTAETVTDQHRASIHEVFGCSIVDQYASSEGAPFIVQCAHGTYHIQPHTGVFEVVDPDLQPSMTGELLVTSFSTRGTPLIRYRVGDSVTLASQDASCPCGFGGAIVLSIDGRKADFVVTPSGARISSVNLSNATKDARGIQQFQVHQAEASRIEMFVVGDETFNNEEEAALVAAVRERVGPEMAIQIKRVPHIPRERSGKFRVVKSSMKSTP